MIYTFTLSVILSVSEESVERCFTSFCMTIGRKSVGINHLIWTGSSDTWKFIEKDTRKSNPSTIFVNRIQGIKKPGFITSI